MERLVVVVLGIVAIFVLVCISPYVAMLLIVLIGSLDAIL